MARAWTLAIDANLHHANTQQQRDERMTCLVVGGNFKVCLQSKC